MVQVNVRKMISKRIFNTSNTTMLIEQGILKHLVRQDNPKDSDLQRDLIKRVKKHMKKHYAECVNLTPIEYTNNEFLFEIRDIYGASIQTYRMIFGDPNHHYGKHMGIAVQWCETPFQLYDE
jgi:hypothetical protein